MWSEDSYDRTRAPKVATSDPEPGSEVVKVAAAEEEALDEDIGEILIAEYLVFLFALDTFMRYVEERTGVAPSDDPGTDKTLDAILRQGLALLRLADRRAFQHLDRILREGLTNPGALKMLDAAMRTLPTARGASLRSLRIRTLLTRGGPSTSKRVFDKNARARKEVLAAIEASMTEDADAALSKFAVINLINKRLDSWIDKASEAAVPILAPVINPVQEASQKVSDQAAALRTSNVVKDGLNPASMTTSDESEREQSSLQNIETQARETAQKVLAKTGEEDKPLTRSEVIGVATAAAAAAAADPTNDQNIPDSLRRLDPEQRVAAMTDGRVLVAAGAGAGKSTTLVARIKYLILEKGVSPSRIFVASFNRVAADNLRADVNKEIGDRASGLQIGTMHSLFRKFIRGGGGVRAFGTPEESAMVSDDRLIMGRKKGAKEQTPNEEFVVVDESGEETTAGSGGGKKPKSPDPSQMTFAVKAMLKELGPAGLAQMTGFPALLFQGIDDILSAKSCKKLMENWRGNGIDFKTARLGAETIEELLASIWQELYSGLKGDLGPQWQPAAQCPSWHRFNKKFRTIMVRRGDKTVPFVDMTIRFGDGDDMIRIFRNIIQRNPEALARAQEMFDHVTVDEAQDLNQVQHDIFGALTDKFDCEGKDGKSMWIVGDDKQAIYQFRGARPSLFSDLADQECWQSRLIQTNYRSTPEIVEAANRIAANNTDQIPMECRAAPSKARGDGSISVITPGDYVDGAYTVLEQFQREMTIGNEPPSDFAVLSRTNAELNAFEDQCILREIPYTRARGGGFLDSPETTSVLAYMDLAMSSDREELQGAFINALTKPDRGLYLSRDAVEKIVKDSYAAFAQESGDDAKAFNPLDIITSRSFAKRLATMLKASYKESLIAAARRLHDQRGGERWLQERERQGGGLEWMYNGAVDAMVDNLMDMGNQITAIRQLVRTGASTTQVLDAVLDRIQVLPHGYQKRGEEKPPMSLREQIRSDRAFNADPEEDGTDDSAVKVEIGEEGMQSARPQPKTVDPMAGLGAVRYLYQLAVPNDKDEALGVDPGVGSGFYRKIARYKEGARELQDPKKYPERMTLSTIHSVKGAQWGNVAVCMSYGFFPGKGKETSNSLTDALSRMGKPDPRPAEPRAQALSTMQSIREDPMTAERNLAYVGVTRSKRNMVVVSSQERVPPAMRQGTQPVLGEFIREAGWRPGENVASPGQPESPPGQPESVVEEVAEEDLGAMGEDLEPVEGEEASEADIPKLASDTDFAIYAGEFGVPEDSDVDLDAALPIESYSYGR